MGLPRCMSMTQTGKTPAVDRKHFVPVFRGNNGITRFLPFWLMPRIKPSIFGMFSVTVFTLVRVCSSFRPAWSPIRAMLAGPTLASRSGSSKRKGTLSRSLHTRPLPATHGPIGYCRGNDRFISLTKAEQSSTHPRVARLQPR